MYPLLGLLPFDPYGNVSQNLVTSTFNAEPYLDRMAAETFATDSYQNIFFSILLFRKKCGRCPTLLTVVTHNFKLRRFLDVHIPACRWPHDSVRFMGIDPPASVTSREALEAAEARRYVSWVIRQAPIWPSLRIGIHSFLEKNFIPSHGSIFISGSSRKLVTVTVLQNVYAPLDALPEIRLC